jgi:hypothetical protein
MEDKKIDENELDIPLKEIKSKKAVKAVRESAKDPEEYTPQETVVNCLRNERITVRHIPKEGGFITNPKHLLYGELKAYFIYKGRRMYVEEFQKISH